MSESVTFDPYAPFPDEPAHEEMAELRKRCPVSHTPSGWFVAEYEDVKDVLQRVNDFTGSFIEAEGFPEDERALMNVDEPEHGRLRKIINGAIARHKTGDMGPFVEELARRFLDQALETARSDGKVDIVEAYAAPIPARVVAQALGVPVRDGAQFQRWADELVERLYDRPPAPYSELHPEFAGYIQELIEQRRAEGSESNDFVSRLMTEGLSDAAIRTHALHLIIAGNETTRSMLGNCIYRLATEPGLFEAVRADRSLIPNLVEESLRFDPPIQVMGRTARHDQSLGGQRIAEGDHLVVGLQSANRDEKVFECPEDFRLDRSRPKEHMAFGAGPHVCPGAFLARLEGVVAVGELVERVASLKLAEGYEFDGNPLFWSRAPLSLDIEVVEAAPDEVGAANRG